ncbi:MAG: NAD(+)/NADH kinase [Verrucomicrobia bacterium]|nr:NAD(+)/NADH kinase [Verrucomicrobiota bacterium]
MKIALYPSLSKEDAKTHISPIANFLKAKGAELFIDKAAKDFLPLPTVEEADTIDIFLVLGGDGTLLSCKQKYNHMENALFTAVNLGSLGFMTDIRLEDAELYFEDLMRKNFRVEERLMLQGTFGENEHHAVNDIVFHRGSIPNMILLEVTINGLSFNKFQADGLIIATPTGSTAYSLAASGPILDSKLQALLITPICVHGLTNRPFITGPDDLLEVTYLSNAGPIQVTVDGIKQFTLQQNETVRLQRSPHTFKLISYERHTLYETLRSKLHWYGSAKKTEPAHITK